MPQLTAQRGAAVSELRAVVKADMQVVPCAAHMLALDDLFTRPDPRYIVVLVSDCYLVRMMQVSIRSGGVWLHTLL